MKLHKGRVFLIFYYSRPFIVILSLIFIGTMGYRIIEGWNWIDSLFMSMMTLTTVGYGEVHPLTTNGVIFTMVYMFFGVILFLYLAAEFANYIVFTNFGKLLGRKNMEARLAKIKDHYIICGYGRTGAEIAYQLKNNNLDFVIIDKNPEKEDSLQDSGFLYITDDATNDTTLHKAKIENAKGLFCCLNDDVDNLYLTLSARDINPKLKIVARCIKVTNEPKFKKAGATTTILPYEISGRRMVASVVKPLVVDFLDVVMHTQGLELELKMEQYLIQEGSILENQTIISSELRQKTGIIIIAIKRDGKFLTNPSPDTIIKLDDYLIVLGTSEQLTKFEELMN